MNFEPFTKKEEALFLKYFETTLDEIELEIFIKKRKQLQAKYHPDKFEKHKDEVVKELALEKYQEINLLCDKAKIYIERKQKGNLSINNNNYLSSYAEFSADGLFIEIITHDKDLKYDMFGTYYKWLQQGDSFNIPDTKAKIRIEADYRGSKIGFNEAIKIYLSFDVTDSVEEVIDWFYFNIKGRARSLLIDKELIPIDRIHMSRMMRKTTFLRLKSL